MTRDIRRRLQKLEPQVPRQTTDLEKETEWLHSFLLVAVAYYLGDPTPEGSIMEAYARALGYPNSYKLRNALDANDEDFDRRRCEANDKLLAKFGVSLEHEEIAEAFKRMKAGLSESYKAVLARSPV